MGASCKISFSLSLTCLPAPTCSDEWDESSGRPGLIKIHNTVKFKAAVHVHQVLGRCPRKDEDIPSLQPPVLWAENVGTLWQWRSLGRGSAPAAPVLLQPAQDGDIVPPSWGILWDTAGGLQSLARAVLLLQGKVLEAREGMWEHRIFLQKASSTASCPDTAEIGEREGMDQISCDTSGAVARDSAPATCDCLFHALARSFPSSLQPDRLEIGLEGATCSSTSCSEQHLPARAHRGCWELQGHPCLGFGAPVLAQCGLPALPVLAL